ncbi:MAG: M3 family metallopeptidase [Deltaproteobacteria bacterium]|nr:M3 family metallopeptidase [Deltaproteobacteria bacterium]
MGANPLLSLSHPLPFDLVRAEHVEPALEALTAQARAALEGLERAPAPGSFEGVILPLERLGGALEDAATLCGQLESLLGAPAFREAYHRAQPKMSAFYASIPLSAPLFERVQGSVGAGLERLAPHHRRLARKTLEGFERSGAALAPAQKARLVEIEVALSELTQSFSRRVVEATDAFSLVLGEERLLAGLPEGARAAARASAAAKGLEGWRFTLQGPSYVAAMTYLDHRPTREALHRAYLTRAAAGDEGNLPVVCALLAFRAEKAALLGFGSVADLHLADRMVRSGAEALSFVEGLAARTRGAFEEERAALERFARERLSWEGRVEGWDVAYLAEKMRQEECDFDEELLRPYFELGGVLRGLFEVAGRLYGVAVRPLTGAPVWHPDVLTFELVEPDGRRGVFYADLHPREGKQGGAWMCPLLYGDGAPERPHVGLIACNFTPPVGGRALLTHGEVETLFHEFGHLLHHLLTRAELRSQAGTNVAWDFVELPSQIMENWCWEREALDLFARHHETGAPIPAPLFERLTRARTFRAATAQMRQLSFALVDLRLHMELAPTLARAAGPEGRAEEAARLARFACEVVAPLSPAPLFEGYAMIAAFGHLFGSPVGYAAGYYSYKWAEALDADAFSRFRREGVFSRAAGEAFRASVLARGSSADPLELFVEFMGRAPSFEPLFERQGLA